MGLLNCPARGVPGWGGVMVDAARPRLREAACSPWLGMFHLGHGIRLWLFAFFGPFDQKWDEIGM